MRGLKVIAIISTLAMLFVQLGGALVTKTGSGQGCGKSWPLCHGEFVPSSIDMALIIELSHRLVSGASALIVLLLAILSWRKIGHIRETKFLAVTAFVSLMVQALIGAGAVVWGQAPVIMALHFGISLISFSTVLLLTLIIFEVDRKFDATNLIIPSNIQKEIIALSIYIYVVIYTGALVRQQKATLACLDFPLCHNNAVGLPQTMFEWVQMGHRTAAIIFFIWLLLFTIKIIKRHKDLKVLYWSTIISFILVCLQVLTGISVIYTMANLYMALLHSLFITCLFGMLSYLLLLVSRSKQKL